METQRHKPKGEANNMKKFLYVFLVLVLALALTVTAAAADSDFLEQKGTLTVTLKTNGGSPRAPFSHDAQARSTVTLRP